MAGKSWLLLSKKRSYFLIIGQRNGRNGGEAIGMMEVKIKEATLQIETLKGCKDKKTNEDVNMEIVMEVVGYFLEHLEFLLLKTPDRIRRVAYFGIIFEQPPTYEEIVFRTPKLAQYIELINTLQ